MIWFDIFGESDKHFVWRQKQNHILNWYMLFYRTLEGVDYTCFSHLNSCSVYIEHTYTIRRLNIAFCSNKIKTTAASISTSSSLALALAREWKYIQKNKWSTTATANINETVNFVNMTITLSHTKLFTWSVLPPFWIVTQLAVSLNPSPSLAFVLAARVFMFIILTFFVTQNFAHIFNLYFRVGYEWNWMEWYE